MEVRIGIWRVFKHSTMDVRCRGGDAGVSVWVFCQSRLSVALSMLTKHTLTRDSLGTDTADSCQMLDDEAFQRLNRHLAGADNDGRAY